MSASVVAGRPRAGVRSRTAGRHRRWIPLAALLAMLVAIAAGPGPAVGGVGEAGQRQPSQRDAAAIDRDLERLRQQIVALERRLGDLGRERRSLVDEWESADVQLALTRNQLAVLRIRLDALVDELAMREQQVADLDERLTAGRRELAARVVALYRMGPLSYTRFMLAADTPEEVLAGYQIVTRLAAQDRNLVATVRWRLEELERAVREMERTRQRLETVRQEEERTLATLEMQQEEREGLIRRIDVEAAAGRAALEAQQRSAEELELMIETLSPGATAAPSAAEAAAPMAAFELARGSLPWPGEGEVTLGFGRHRHPVYDTYTLSKGIEIAAEPGSPVRAVFPGEVVFADWFKGYGLVVILDHGDAFYTLYGHLGTFVVRMHEEVEPGQQLGIVGDTGSLQGPSLYFEIREATEALNPLRWLRER